MLEKTELDLVWVLLSAVLVIAMQGGFLCLESGVTRTKNSINVALKNAVDFTVVIIVFWLFGFGIMFGSSINGWIGGTLYFPDVGVYQPWLATFFLFQAMFCATTATIVSGAIAERVRFNAYIFITLLIAGLVYPVFGHWAWGGGFTGETGWLQREGFVDFAGSTVVHSAGGWVAFALLLRIGPRIGRFERGQPVAITASNLPLAMLGLLLFVVGWVGFNGGSTLAVSHEIPGIITNTILAAAAGMMTAHLLQVYLSPDMDRVMAPINGALAGLVSITASCHAVGTISAIMIAVIGAICMLICDRWLLRHQVDDAVGAVPVHLAAGIWGTLAVALFAEPEILGTGHDRMTQLFIQLEGIVVCGLWCFSVTWILSGKMDRLNPIRVSEKEEYIGLNVAEHGARSMLFELVEVMERQSRTFDFSLRAPVEPFTELGQIAGSYNRVVNALEETTKKTRQIIRDIRDGIITFTKDGILTSMNPGAEKLLQVEAGVAIGQSLDQLFLESNLRVRESRTRLHAKGRAAGVTDSELVRKDQTGERMILEYKTFPGKDASQETYTAIIRDVTGQRIAEDELFMEKEHAQVTLESIGEGVITTDGNDNIKYINPVAAEILGQSETSVIGTRLQDSLKLCHETTNEKIPIGFTETPKDAVEIFRQGPLLIKRRDNTELSINLTSSPIRNREKVLIGSVIVIQDITKSRELERVLSYQATHDAITGLLNRREFEQRLIELIKESRVDAQHHVICYVDLDQFKIVNDTCGHNAGDELLRQLSSLLTESLRASDTLARLGGDEFGILLHNCSLERGQEIATGLRKKIEEFRFSWQQRTFSVGASIGIAGISKHSESAAELMSMADAACYAAKDAGRNRVHIHSPDDSDVKQRWGQMHWASRIQEAIDEDRLRLYFQEIRPSSDNGDTHKHFEIFIRMVDADGSMVPPGAFIPAAERYDLMTSLDKWVVKNTLAWMGSNKINDILAINLSGASINNNEFLDNIKDLISYYRIKPEQLCFEITETAAISDMVKARHFIDELKILGCKFSLDDFGSGLSSFGYLKTLPVDYLKIDGMFVRDIIKDPFDEAMVQSINNVGQLMGLKTIAEFVESEEIMQRLADIGVDYVQGYYIGKPEPLQNLTKTNLWPR